MVLCNLGRDKCSDGRVIIGHFIWHICLIREQALIHQSIFNSRRILSTIEGCLQVSVEGIDVKSLLNSCLSLCMYKCGYNLSFYHFQSRKQNISQWNASTFSIQASSLNTSCQLQGEKQVCLLVDLTCRCGRCFEYPDYSPCRHKSKPWTKSI